jgi:hypothetical protein
VGAKGFGNEAGVISIIGIEGADKLPAGCVQPGEESCDLPLVLIQGDQLDAAIADVLDDRLRRCAMGTFGTVIDNDTFPVWVGLISDR